MSLLSFILVLGTLLQPAICQPGVGQRFLSNNPAVEYEQTNEKPTYEPVFESGCDESGDSSSNGAGVHPSEFYGVFQKLGTNWVTILKLFRNVVGSAGGTTTHQDVFAETMNEALVSLKEMVSSAIADERGTSQQWSFYTVPYQEFDRTLDDMFVAFLNWAAADEAPDSIKKCDRRGSVNGRESKINVSKAFRRLENYSVWMDNSDLLDPPLTASSLQNIWKSFSMKLSYDDCQRIVWWLDLGAVDFEVIRTVPPKEIHRLFVWISHYMLFDEKAQENGMVFINSLANIHFWTFMTMLPLDLGMKLDEFVISVIPLKTKFVLLLERPPWAKFAYQLLKPFLKMDMRRRVVVIEDTIPPSFVAEVLGGKHCIPNGFDGLEGTPNADIAGPYFESKSKKRKSHW
jgi:hypothetical protein